MKNKIQSSCPSLEDLSNFVDDESDTYVREHLEGCEKCKKIVDEYRNINSFINEYSQPSPELAEDIIALCRREQVKNKVKISWWSSPYLRLAACLALVAGLLWIGYSAQKPESPDEPNNPPEIANSPVVPSQRPESHEEINNPSEIVDSLNISSTPVVASEEAKTETKKSIPKEIRETPKPSTAVAANEIKLAEPAANKQQVPNEIFLPVNGIKNHDWVAREVQTKIQKARKLGQQYQQAIFWNNNVNGNSTATDFQNYNFYQYLPNSMNGEFYDLHTPGNLPKPSGSLTNLPK